MLLHFIFVIKDTDLGKRDKEFNYIKQMADEALEEYNKVLNELENEE